MIVALVALSYSVYGSTMEAPETLEGAGRAKRGLQEFKGNQEGSGRV